MRAIASLCVLVGGCGAAAPALVASSDYGSRSASSSVHSGFAVPAHESGGDLVVGPDALALHFALAGWGPDAARAQAAAKEKIDQLVRRAGEATGAAVELRLCGFRLAEEGEVRWATVDGALQVALRTDGDY